MKLTDKPLESRHCEPLEGHPAMGAVPVRFDTRTVGGSSLNDFVRAAKADALFA